MLPRTNSRQNSAPSARWTPWLSLPISSADVLKVLALLKWHPNLKPKLPSPDLTVNPSETELSSLTKPVPARITGAAEGLMATGKVEDSAEATAAAIEEADGPGGKASGGN